MWRALTKQFFFGLKTEAIFFFLISRTNYELHLPKGHDVWITDLALKLNVTVRADSSTDGIIDFWNAERFWVKLQKVPAEEGASILSLISLFFLLVSVSFKKDVYVMVKSYLYPV